MVIISTASLTFSNSTLCPHSVFMCFVWIWEKTAIISLYSINWLVFIIETGCFLRGTSWIFKRAGVRVQSQDSPSDLWWQSGTGTGFSPSTSVFPVHYHPIIAPHSSSCCSYLKDERAKLGHLPKISASKEMVKRCIQTIFHLVL